MAILALAVLGPFQVSLDSGPATQFRTKTAQALLAYLAVETRSPLSRDYLSELLWPGMPPASARRNLRQTLYEIRKLIPDISASSVDETVPLLLADRQTVQLNPAAQIVVDIDDFEQQLEQGTDSSLLEVEKIYRAEFLAGFYLPDNNVYESWLLEKRAEYQRKLLDALGRLADSSLQKGNYGQAERCARKQLLQDDLREPAIRQLITAMAQQGQRVGALSEYEQYRERLDKELNVDPDPELEKLAAVVREGSLDDYLGVIPPKAAGDQDQVIQRALVHDKDGIEASRKQVPTNLPVPATPFIGRRNELAQLKEMLQEDVSTRLITLLGPGGSGKTRLAIQIASELAAKGGGSYKDGIWFVSLAKLTEAKSIVTEVASILRFSFTGQDLPAKQQLLDYLCQKKMLLVFDNYEHLLEPGTSPLAADIPQAAANVKILVTSRTRLNVQGESLLPITGLSMVELEDPQNDGDQQHSDAVQLFADSARRIRPEFNLTLENQESVKRICELVEGSPLAVELAAAWIELLSPNEIAREIEENLDFLEIEWQDVPERQRSLRAVFNGSWKLLPETEREAIKRLTLFQGSFSHEAAAAVAGASLKLLLDLANRSWLIRDDNGRYHIHNLLRYFANDKLQNDKDLWLDASEAHTDYYCSLMTRLCDEMKGLDQILAFDMVAAEFENFRTVWYRLLDEGRLTRIIDSLLLGVFLFCSARARGEDLVTLVKEAQEPLLAVKSTTLTQRQLSILMTVEIVFIPGRSVLTHLITHFASWVFDKSKVEFAWQQFQNANYADVDPLWSVINATLYGWEVDSRSAADRLRLIIAYCEKEMKRWSQAYAMKNLARLLTQGGTIAFQDLGAIDGTIQEDDTLLVNARRSSEEGIRLLSEAESIFFDIGDQLERANTLRLSGLVKSGFKLDEAEQELKAAVKIMISQGDLSSATHVLWNLAEISIMKGEVHRGFQYYDEMISFTEQLGNQQLLAGALSFKSISLVRYGAIEEGREERVRSLSLSQQTQDEQLIAWSLWELGDIDRIIGDFKSARNEYNAAQDIFQRINSNLGLAFYYRGIGDLELAEGDPASALKSYRKSLDLAQSIHYWSVVHAQVGRGRALLALGEYQAAEDEFRNALKLATDINHIDLSMIVLSGICKMLAANGQLTQAVELGTSILKEHMTWVEIRIQVDEILTLAAEKLSEDEFKAAQERGSKSAREAVVAHYLTARSH